LRFTKRQLAALRSKLQNWFAGSARDLPWRNTSDPYAIWVSEIMLQQTQVATVIPYYYRFLKKFPTVVALASATEKTVLSHWEGLGYYRRARQMHAAAKKIVDSHDSVFPVEHETILALPGIGRYTAGAISSFAYNDRRPILEANTQRLYARLLGWPKRLSLAESRCVLWEFAERLADCENAGRVNQALMELGSQVCRPRAPLCTECPLRANCVSFNTNQVDVIPAPEEKTKYESRDEAAVLLNDSEGSWLVRLCKDGERWAGLWDFPRYEMTSSGEHESSLKSNIRRDYGLTVSVGEKCHEIKHGVTRYRITLHVYSATLAKPPKALTRSSEAQWVSTQKLKTTPLNASARKIASMLQRRTPVR
jgi:A/G-specific adenine glycosylase